MIPKYLEYWLGRGIASPRRPPRPGKPKKTYRWLAILPDWAAVLNNAAKSVSVEAPTKSEARAMAKKRLGLKPKQRLPAGTQVSKF